MTENCLFVWAIRTNRIHAPVVEHKLIFAKNIVNFDIVFPIRVKFVPFDVISDSEPYCTDLNNVFHLLWLPQLVRLTENPQDCILVVFSLIKLIIPWGILFHYWFQSLDFNISYHLKMLKLIFYMYWPFILIGRQVMPSSSRWNFTKRSLSPDLIWVIRVISWFRFRRSVRKVTWCELFPYSFWR